MPSSQIIVHWNRSATRLSSPSRLRALGKDEIFLESIIAQHPGLLGLENRRTGIYGPFVCFRQVPLKTPAGRLVYPDVVILASSGHFIVVEVKLGDNAELKDRDVIAQIIDYASSFASMNEKQLVDLFEKSLVTSPTWFDFVSKQFPEDDNPGELARVIRERIAAGEINLVIACDQVPSGLPEIVRGVASQQSTSFSLDLVEITPYCDPENDEDICFIPSNRLSTEIVSRTTVTVAYQGTTPDVAIETTNTQESSPSERGPSKNSLARVWPPEEVEQVVRQAGDPLEIQLLEFCKHHSSGGDFVSPAIKSNAAFGFFVVGRRSDGKKAKNMLFWVTHGWSAMYINLSMARQLVDESTSQELERKLATCFDNQVDVHAPNPGVKLSLLSTKLADFQQIVLWFQQEVIKRASVIG
jgi:hypothetical protein